MDKAAAKEQPPAKELTAETPQEPITGKKYKLHYTRDHELNGCIVIKDGYADDAKTINIYRIIKIINEESQSHYKSGMLITIEKSYFDSGDIKLQEIE